MLHNQKHQSCKQWKCTLFPNSINNLRLPELKLIYIPSEAHRNNNSGRIKKGKGKLDG